MRYSWARMATKVETRARRIQRSIREEERRLVRRAPWLRQRDAIGAALLAVSESGMVSLGAL